MSSPSLCVMCGKFWDPKGKKNQACPMCRVLKRTKPCRTCGEVFFDTSKGNNFGFCSVHRVKKP